MLTCLGLAKERSGPGTIRDSLESDGFGGPPTVSASQV
jgi:hypothetical protein